MVIDKITVALRYTFTVLFITYMHYLHHIKSAKHDVFIVPVRNAE